MQKQKVAFFDIDGTLFRWSLFIEYVNALINVGVLPKNMHLEFQDKYERWLNREGTFQDYIDAMVASFNKNIIGVRVNDFIDVTRDALEAKRKRVYRYTRDLIRDLKDDGYFVVAISHSAKIALDLFTESYGFDKVYGVMLEIEDGVFTGEILNKAQIFDKGKIVERVFNQEDLNLTKQDSIAVGDTHSDISMLEAVDKPIAFNPNKILYNEAKKRKWDIVVERKDVIYRI